MGLLRNAVAVLCCVFVLGVVIGAFGISRSRRRGGG
jgi:hypothetical protein